MTQSMRVRFLLGSALLFVPLQAHSQDQSTALRPTPIVPRRPLTVAAVHPAAAVKRARLVRHVAAPQPAPVLTAAAVAPPPKPAGLVAAVTLADIGFVNGVRFANLGGHRELFVPLPEMPTSWRRASRWCSTTSRSRGQRNLEVQVNDRTVAAIALDGKSRGRSVDSVGRPAEGRLSQAFVSLFRRRHARSLHRRALCRRQPHGQAGDRDRGRDRCDRRARRRHDGRADAARVAVMLPGRRVTEPRSRPPSRSRARFFPAAGG